MARLSTDRSGAERNHESIRPTVRTESGRIRCSICGDPGNRYRRRGPYFKCRVCKAAFRPQHESADELDEYWKQAFWTEDEVEKRKRREPVFRQAFQILHGRKPGGGSVLDIGCGIGTFLAVCRKAGWTVTGVDPSPVACGVAKKEYDLELIQDSFSSGMFPDRTFDAVFAAQVLHHLPDPAAFLADMDRVLVKGGVLMLRTPNLIPQELFLRCQRLLGWRAKVFCGPALHVFHPDSMSLLLRRLGYDEVGFLNSRPFLEAPQWLGAPGRPLAVNLRRLGVAAVKLVTYGLAKVVCELSGGRLTIGPSIFVVARKR